MTGFNVESAELLSAQAYMDELATEAQTRAEAIRGEVESLLASGWRGGAASGFRSGWEQWDAGYRQLLIALQDMADLLGATGQGYAYADEDSASHVSSVGAS